MSQGKPYKHGKKGAGRFVQLPHWLLATEAWRHLSLGARSLYIEFKRRYTGSNNGSLRLSHREAAELLNVHRNTVGQWFRELEDAGFIRMMQGHYLGPSGIGQSALWALDEYSTDTDMKPALKRFVQWRPKQKPRTENRTPRHKSCDAPRLVAE